MPKSVRWFPLMRKLDERYQMYCQQSMSCAPRNGDLPVGGGDWMDNFFKAEAIRGTLTAMRHGKEPLEAAKDGKAVAEISIQIWNDKREYQVQRWNGWVEDFIQSELKIAGLTTHQII